MSENNPARASLEVNTCTFKDTGDFCEIEDCETCNEERKSFEGMKRYDRSKKD